MLTFCQILPESEPGRMANAAWQLPAAKWQHSATNTTPTPLQGLEKYGGVPFPALDAHLRNIACSACLSALCSES